MTILECLRLTDMIKLSFRHLPSAGDDLECDLAVLESKVGSSLCPLILQSGGVMNRAELFQASGLTLLRIKLA